MEIHFILVRPVVPENIGFVCRAIKNMGFNSLMVVGSDKHTKKGAQNTAYDSHDILENIRTFTQLEEATRGMDLVIGTTAKKRKLRHEYIPSENLKNFLNEREKELKHVAIVFGSESDGLSGDEEKCCDILSTVAMAQDYPSINLSHSVMIYAYELSELAGAPLNQESAGPQDTSKFSAFKSQVNDFLEILEIEQRQPGLFHEIRDRLFQMKPRDVSLFMSASRYLRNYLKK